MKRLLTMAWALFAGAVLAEGTVAVTSVTAQQRYPWNGKVDIVVTIQGDTNAIAQTECLFAATNCATKAAVPVTAISQVGSDSVVGDVCTRHYLWESTNDVGAVKIDDLALTVGAEGFGGVQLWENGPYWAECNVGATKPEEYGYYFWWGDTVGYKRNANNNGWVSVKDGASFQFNELNCPTYNKDISTLQSLGYIDSSGDLVASHDAATAHLGVPWRMPTDAEMIALLNNCDAVWTTRNGVYGRLITGRGTYASKNIFLPAAAGGRGFSLGDIGSTGGYWSSAPDMDDSRIASILSFGSGGIYLICGGRFAGQSIRPLREFVQNASATVLGSGVLIHMKLDCRIFVGKSVTITSPQETMAEMFGESRTNVETIVIGEGTTELPNGFFAGCSALKSVTLPSTVVLSKADAQELKSFSKLYAAQSDGYWVLGGWLLGYKGTCPNEIPGAERLKGVADGALKSCLALEHFVPSGTNLVYIGEEAFDECFNLEEVVLPGSVTEIGRRAFYGDSLIETLSIPGSVKTIGEEAFAYLTELKSIGFASGIQSIGARAFYDDYQVTEVFLPSTVTSVGDLAFGGDSSIIRAGIRADIRPMREIFSNYAHIREFIVHPSYSAINGCFSGCTELADVHYLGNAPIFADGGASFYQGTPETLTTYIGKDSTGWNGVVGAKGKPQAWPKTGSYRRSIAYWDIPTYEVEFDANGGSLGVQVTYQKSEEHFTLPATPTQSGYIFNGWWTSPAGGWQVTEKTIFIEGVYQRLYAHWYKGHRIFLNPDGGYVYTDTIEYVDQTVYGVLPTPTRSGYAFGGWIYYVDGTKQSTGRVITEDTSIATDADHTLYAQWTAYKYSVRFDANGGTSGTMAIQQFTYDTLQSLNLNQYGRPGWSFVGWAKTKDGEVVYHDGERVKNLTDLQGECVVLYAVWKQTGYTVRFVTPAGTGTMSDQLCTCGKVHQLPTCTFRNGSRRFRGWWCEQTNRRYDDGMLIFNLAGPGETVTMTAIWE